MLICLRVLPAKECIFHALHFIEVPLLTKLHSFKSFSGIQKSSLRAELMATTNIS